MFAMPSIAGAAETTFTYQQPIKVAGYEVKQGLSLIPNPDVDGFITHMETDIVDGDGNPIPISRLMLHHIVYLNLNQTDSTCNSYKMWDGSESAFGAPQRFYGAGEERATMILPDGYGYPTRTEENWAMTYMVMNHRKEVDEAYIKYTATVSDDPSITAVTPYWMDEVNCQTDPIYNVPGNGGRGSKQERKWNYTMPESGRLVAGGGHVHGGAYRLTLNEPDCDNRRLVKSIPTWGLASHPFYNVKPVLHEPGPISMSGINSEAGIPVAAGERLTLNSIYDNSRPHVRVMGIMVAYFAPDASITEECGPIPDDVEILKTDQPGRSEPPRYRIPIYNLNEQGDAVRVKAPPGDLEKAESGTTVGVEGRAFTKPNLKVKSGSRLNWQFDGAELHNLTLANGPVGIGSDNLARFADAVLGKPREKHLFFALVVFLGFDQMVRHVFQLNQLRIASVEILLLFHRLQQRAEPFEEYND
jgi:hypothetical protein